jgi:hypothetical protein
MGETAVPSISRPDTVPLPSVAATLVAVTAPPKSATEESVTRAVLHVEPLAVDELKATSEADAGYPEGPRLDAGVPSATGEWAGGTTAAAPAPTHPAGSEELVSGA